LARGCERTKERRQQPLALLGAAELFGKPEFPPALVSAVCPLPTAGSLMMRGALMPPVDVSTPALVEGAQPGRAPAMPVVSKGVPGDWTGPVCCV
jgi:hypothetical protein